MQAILLMCQVYLPASKQKCNLSTFHLITFHVTARYQRNRLRWESRVQQDHQEAEYKLLYDPAPIKIDFLSLLITDYVNSLLIVLV